MRQSPAAGKPKVVDDGTGDDPDLGTGSTDGGSGSDGGTGGNMGDGGLGNLFGGSGGTGTVTTTTHEAPQPTSGLNLLGQIESWGINAGSKVNKVSITAEHMNGAQLEKLLKELPDGVTYGLNLEKEDT